MFHIEGGIMFLTAGLLVFLGTSYFVDGRVDLTEKAATLRSEGVYGVAEVEGFDLDGQPGKPLMPQKSYFVVLPEGARPDSVKIVDVEYEYLGSGIQLKPARRPAILPMPGIDMPPPPEEKDAGLYSSAGPYPSSPLRLVGSSLGSGERLAELILFPLRYYPEEGKLFKVSRLRFRLFYHLEGSGGNSIRSDIGFYRRMVINPNDLPSHRFLPPRDYLDYVVLTGDNLASAFEPLVEWKRQKGLRAAIRTISWINSNYTGRDLAEKIRNYLKVAYADSGLKWVLLGGDVDIVPARVAYAMTSGAGFFPDEDSLRADLYYSDLDGSWDADGDGVFGEVTDSVDLYPEVFVGRAPVRNLSEAQAFVDKVLAYEKNPPLDYLEKALFFAEILWQDPYTDSGEGKNQIDSLYVPDYIDVQKLYESLGNENRNTVLGAINSGKNFLNHAGHGNYYVMGAGDDYLYPDDMDALTNGDKQGILFSIGCWVGAFDYDAISEHFIRNPEGGGVAFIGNSRYGWGSPGNPGYGYSFKFDKELYRLWFQEGVVHVGEALALAKAVFIPFSREENVYRWHQYQLNLLGDPEMEIWTFTPGSLRVLSPDSLPQGPFSLSVSVMAGGTPISGALATLLQNGELIACGQTGQNGVAALNLVPQGPDSLLLTATRTGYLHAGKVIYLSEDGSYPGYLGMTVVDSAGNGDGLLNPGESARILPRIFLAGTDGLGDLSLVLHIEGGPWSASDSILSLGSLDPGDTALVEPGFEVQIADTASNGASLTATLGLLVSGVERWNFQVSELVALPVIYVRSISIEAGGDTVPEPGEEVTMDITLGNSGLAPSESLQGAISSPCPYLSFQGGGNISLPPLDPDGTHTVQVLADVDGGTPVPYLATLIISLHDTSGRDYGDTVFLLLGRTGYSYDVEVEDPNWYAGGSWHRSDYRSHSGDYSWYCGSEVSHSYSNYAADSLISPWILVGYSPILRFWHWFEATTYGNDGLYLFIGDESGWHVLDYIGSGGALDSLMPIGNSWAELSYELDGYEPGDSIRVMFLFRSDDSEVAEGFYIDDISISGVYQGLYAEETPSRLQQDCQLFTGRIPLMGLEEVRYLIPRPGYLEISLYDVSGRRVETLFSGKTNMTSGKVSIDPFRHPSGYYFLTLKLDGKILRTRKVLLLR